MTAYIANHQKKKRILAKKEAKLRRLIRNGEKEVKILEAAEEVKDARIRVLNVEKSQIAPNKEKAFEEIDNKIASIQSLTLTKIIDEYSIEETVEKYIFLINAPGVMLRNKPEGEFPKKDEIVEASTLYDIEFFNQLAEQGLVKKVEL